MRPYCCFLRISQIAFAGFTVPITWTCMTASKSLSSILAKLLSRRMPALAISTSMRPHLSMVCWTRWATPASSLTEAPLAIAVAAGVGDLLHHGFRRRRVAAGAVDRAAEIVDDDLRAAPGEFERMGAAQSAAGAGDDDNLAVEANGHGKCSFRMGDIAGAK